MSKKIVVPTGYMGSGSSAITDILKEYSNVNTKNYDFEYIFLHMPGGLFDFEDKLFLNNNSLRSDEAIKSFRNNIKDLYKLRGWWPGNYKKYVTKNFLDIVEKYISKIKESNFQGTWYYNEKYKGYKFYKRALKNRIYKILKKKIILEKFDIEYSFISKEDFYKYSCEFIYDIVKEINIENKDLVLLDQLILPHNVHRLKNYKYVNILPIVVERDPRDVFLLNKYFWVPNGFPIPYPLDAESFCKYYKKLRKNEIIDSEINVLRLKFEDLIFNYDKSLKQIESYLGLEENSHINKKEFFNPEISLGNIGLYKQDKYKDEVKIIEKYLYEYLYNIEKEIDNNNNFNPF